MKKIILIFCFLIFFSVSFSAELILSPSQWYVWKDCVEEFSIVLSLLPGEETIASDIIFESNMDFVSFENGDVFKYSAPVKKKWNQIKLLLFSDRWNEIDEWWLVWKIYYKVNSDESPYLNFVFYEKWDTTDTNISIEWMDILVSARWGNYSLDKIKSCNHSTEVLTLKKEETLDDFVNKFESDHKMEDIKKFFIKHQLLFYWILLLALVFFVWRFIKRKNYEK